MESPCASLSLKPAPVLRDKVFSPRGSRAHVPQKAENDNARHRGHVAKVSFKIKVSGTGERKMRTGRSGSIQATRVPRLQKATGWRV